MIRVVKTIIFLGFILHRTSVKHLTTGVGKTNQWDDIIYIYKIKEVKVEMQEELEQAYNSKGLKLVFKKVSKKRTEYSWSSWT